MTRRQLPLTYAPRRLLAIVDPGAAAQPALGKALRLARAFRARLEIYACDWCAGLDGKGAAAAALRHRHLADGEAALRELVRRHAPGARRLTVRYEFGHPRVRSILAHVRRARPELVVVDSHFHPGVRRALFGPADWPLIRDCPVPLLYAKPGRWHLAPRIAAAVDPGHAADSAAQLDLRLVAGARAFARALSGSLHVVHAWLPLEPGRAGPAALGLPLVAPAEAERLVTLAEARACAAIGSLTAGPAKPRAEVVLLRGAAVETLPGFAEVEGLDVLVLGAVSRSHLFEALIGATAERLLERVPCDLLIMKSPVAARRRGRQRIPV